MTDSVTHRGGARCHQQKYFVTKDFWIVLATQNLMNSSLIIWCEVKCCGFGLINWGMQKKKKGVGFHLHSNQCINKRHDLVQMSPKCASLDRQYDEIKSISALCRVSDMEDFRVYGQAVLQQHISQLSLLNVPDLTLFIWFSLLHYLKLKVLSPPPPISRSTYSVCTKPVTQIDPSCRHM